MLETNITGTDIPIDHIPSNIVIYRYSNGDFLFVDFNKAAEKTEKIYKEELLGKYLTDVFPGVKAFGLFDVLLRIYQNGGQEEHDVCFYADERISGWRHNLVSKLPNGDIIVSYTDMTRLKLLEEEHLKQKDQLEEAQKIAHLGSWEWNIKTNEIIWSDEVFRIFGEEPQSFNPTYDVFLSYLCEEGRLVLNKAIERAISKNEQYLLRHKVHRKDGTVRHVQESGTIRFDDQGDPLLMIGTVLDITDQVHLEESMKLYKSAVEQSKSSIYITDNNGLIEYVNPYFSKMTGYHLDEVIGKNPRIFKSGKQSKKYYKDLWDTILSGKAWRGELLNRYKDGSEVYGMTSISPIKDEKGMITHFVAVREDITELKDLQIKLMHQAYFDTLTNIPNRAFFFDHLEKTLAISKRKKHDFALLFIDLDGFKTINDSYGHAIGDQLLIQVSKKIQECIRKSDTLARMGGDEFVILLSEIKSNDEPGITAERIIDIVAEPFEISGYSCNIGVSIGISLYPEHGTDPDQLLALADKAMYRAKSSDRKYYYAK